MDEQLMPKPAFAALKASDDLGLSVPRDAVAYLSEARQSLDFNLKRLGPISELIFPRLRGHRVSSFSARPVRV